MAKLTRTTNSGHWHRLGIFNPFAPGAETIDPLKPWKIISQNNIFIVYLSILLFAFYAFTRHGLNWIALSTSLIASIPVGFAIAFFETQAMELKNAPTRPESPVARAVQPVRARIREQPDAFEGRRP